MSKQTSLEELGRRAVACKHWRWMPGMLVGGWVIDGACPHQWANGNPWRQERNNIIILPDELPDLSDPATLGCLLHLVQEAWNACRISVCFSAYMPDATKRWSVPISFFKDQRDLVHVPSFYGETQAEALVAALEAAP